MYYVGNVGKYYAFILYEVNENYAIVDCTFAGCSNQVFHTCGVVYSSLLLYTRACIIQKVNEHRTYYKGCFGEDSEKRRWKTEE